MRTSHRLLLQLGKPSPRPRIHHHNPLRVIHHNHLHTTHPRFLHPTHPRSFHTSSPRYAIRPFILSDPGEGIKEVQIIQWFVQPGARVEQFDKICEVASDKANIEITSRYDGVVKRLWWEQDDVVAVGKALCDIDVVGELEGEEEGEGGSGEGVGSAVGEQRQEIGSGEVKEGEKAVEGGGKAEKGRVEMVRGEGKYASLATPAVRGLLKEMNVDIRDVKGTGKDGRVLKEDIHRYVAERDAKERPPTPASESTAGQSAQQSFDVDSPQAETPVNLTNIQHQMFKTMTRSLSIPHFLYADEVDITTLSQLRTRLNNTPPSPLSSPQTHHTKFSYLPFILKAVSLALHSFPLLNARLSTSTSQPPQLIHRTNHNIGIAMATPSGLLVPNIKTVSALSITAIATELIRLQNLATAGKLSAKDLSGGTITVSNIGSIGGTYVSPIIVEGEVAILGVGKKRVVPAFDEEGKVVRREVMNFSWSADHRVVDGARMARMAEVVKGFVEQPEMMLARLR